MCAALRERTREREIGTARLEEAVAAHQASVSGPPPRAAINSLFC
jgi:hypothetical protein